MQGVPCLKRDPVSNLPGRSLGGGWLGHSPFQLERETEETAGTQVLGGANETSRKIDADNFRNLPCQLKGGASDRAAQVQGPVRLDFFGLGLRQKQGGTGGGKVLDPEWRPVSLRKKGGGLEIMKSQILRESGGGFVTGFQARSCSR